MEIKLDPEVMKLVVSKAILEQFDPATRAQLVENAVAKLLNDVPSSGGYGNQDRRTQIMRMFDEAIAYAAQNVVRELINHEYKARIEAVAREALEKAFADTNRMEKVAQAVGEAIGRGLTSEKY